MAQWGYVNPVISVCCLRGPVAQAPGSHPCCRDPAEPVRYSSARPGHSTTEECGRSLPATKGHSGPDVRITLRLALQKGAHRKTKGTRASHTACQG